MKRKSYVIIVMLFVLLLIFAISFKVNVEKERYNKAKEAVEIKAVDALGEGCILLSDGLYVGPEPFGRGFWFGYVDKAEIKTIVFTAVPTLDGKNWFVQEHISRTGGNPYELFRVLTE